MAASLAVLTASSCVGLRATPAPMRTVAFADGTRASRCAVVLLPGRWDDPEDFGAAGFPRLLEEHGVEARVVSPDAHLGYYAKGTVLERLQADVVGPARAAGRDRVWLAGVSMGGLGGLLFLKAHPDEVAGVIVIAPFLGDDKVIREIEDAGGLDAWRPRLPLAPDDYQRDLWLWLREVTAGQTDPRIVLAYGTGDRFARANALLASRLPSSHVFTAPGGHDWRTWRTLWNDVLNAGIVQPGCS